MLSKTDKANLQAFYSKYGHMNIYAHPSELMTKNALDDLIDDLEKAHDALNEKFIRAIRKQVNAMETKFECTKEETDFFKELALKEFKDKEKELIEQKDAFILDGSYMRRSKELEQLQTLIPSWVDGLHYNLHWMRFREWQNKQAPIYRRIYEDMQAHIDAFICDALEAIKTA